MKYKNLLIIVLIVILVLATILVGCGGSGTTATQEEGSKTAVTEETVEKFAEESTDEETFPTESAKQDNKEQYSSQATTKESTKATESTKSTQQATKAATKPAQQTTKVTEAVKICYITIDGYCSSKSIEINNGDSVYDILKKSGANISARTTGYGLYVEGINGRFEFDEGPTSGWVYTVNGSRISKSCDKCEVKSGDKIVWTYVDEI